MTTRSNTKKVLSDDAKKAKITSWVTGLKLSANTASQLIDKYGIDYAYKLTYDSMMKPYDLAKLLGIESRSSAKMVSYLANTNISPDKLSKALNVSVDEVNQKMQQGINTDSAPVVEATQNQSTSGPEKEKSPVNGVIYKEIFDAEIEKEFTRLKDGKDGNLTFADLEKLGFSQKDLEKYIKPEDLKHIAAGPTSLEVAAATAKVDKNMSSTNKCLSCIQKVLRRPDGYPNVQKVGNSNAGGYFYQAAPYYGLVSIKCKNDIKGQNQYLKDICPGAIVSLTPGQRTIYGHVTCMGNDGVFHCDSTQRKETICAGVRYGDKAPYGKDIYVSYTKDCTLSDDLVKDILRRRELDRLGITEKDLLPGKPHVPVALLETSVTKGITGDSLLSDPDYLQAWRLLNNIGR